VDHLKLATELLALAQGRSVRIATVESCTGGLLAGAITDIPGASDIFERGYVTYSNSAKRDLVGVKQSTLGRCGAVSEQVACEMAEGGRAAARVDIAIAITGIAGPGGSGNKPEGRVCFALAASAKPTHSETVEFGAIGRGLVRERSVHHALKMLITAFG